MGDARLRTLESLDMAPRKPRNAVTALPNRARSTSIPKLTPEELEQWRLRVSVAEFLRAEDLILLGYADTRRGLYRRIDEGRFPPGQLIGERSRRWTRSELAQWASNLPKPNPAI